jgi:hypothetical protein
LPFLLEKDVRSDDEGGEDAPEEDREGDKKEN